MGTLLLAGCAPSVGEPELTVGVGFEDLERADWEALNSRLDDVDARGVTLGVGRPEWVGFPWEGHEEVWASWVEDDEDRVAEAIAALDTDPDGEARDVTLVIDTLVPAWIEEDPDLAGINDHDEPSSSFPSASALSGDVGDAVVDLCGAVAERYQPDRIALTELILEQTYGEDDLELFAAWADREPDDGWPDDEAEIGRWRASVVTDLVARCVEAAGEHGVDVDMDVRVNWDEPGGDRLDSGHDYAALLEAGAHLTLWNYFPLNDRDPAYSEEITAGLVERFGAETVAERVTMSVGLWTDGDDDAAGARTEEALDPAAMRDGVERSSTNGVTRVSVTPLSMMSGEHWEQLAALRD